VAKLSVSKKASDLRNVVLGANDGIVTTFAIIAGSAGAHLSSSIVVILGSAKLVADAISMAVGVYMGTRTEVELEKAKNEDHWKQDKPVRQGALTFFSFILAGFFPLAPFVFNLESSFIVSTFILVVLLFVLGCFRCIGTRRNIILGGFEMLAVGGGAALAAYLIGFLVETYVI
jgi:VIT1/CCC1 family predicted Fe2+/Mn2+ transporter